MSDDDLPDVEELEAQIEQLHHDCLNASGEIAYLRDVNERARQTARLADDQAQRRIRELEDNYAALSKRLDEWRDLADARAVENDRLRAEVADLAHAVHGMQAMHARLGTGADEDEEDAFRSAYEDAVRDVLALDVSGETT